MSLIEINVFFKTSELIAKVFIYSSKFKSATPSIICPMFVIFILFHFYYFLG